MLDNDSVALEILNEYLTENKYFKDLGAVNGKVSINKDFIEFLSMDKNMDADISEKYVNTQADNAKIFSLKV